MSMQPSQKSAPRNFSTVETWVFDLDNTLYPHDLNLWQQIDDRIRSFVSDFLKVTKEEAFRVQKDYYKRYGTTMRGLMTEHGLDPDDFLDAGDRVVVLGRMRGRAKSSGAEFEVEFAHVWALTDGVPSWFRGYFDTGPILAALQASER